MSFQQCRFNFGAEEFKYPPNRKFSVFNDFGVLKPQDKVVDIDVESYRIANDFPRRLFCPVTCISKSCES